MIPKPQQQGIRTDRGDQARAIEHHNARLIDLQAQRRDLDLQLDAGEARHQFRAVWQQHQAEQARQQQIQDLAECAAAEFRRQLDTHQEAEPTRERAPAHRRKPEHDRERELKRTLRQILPDSRASKGCALWTPKASKPMALYHLSVKTISRRTGRSATGASAYRAGVEITDARTGLVHDYRRRGGVVHQELFTPAEAPAWAQDRVALWNAAEHAERRQDATVAREIEISLPHELNPVQRLALARAFSQTLSERHRVAVDLAIHAPHRGDPRNHHAHLLFSTRRLEATGFTEKTREWDNRQPAKGLTGQHVVEHWRQAWEQQANQALEQAGYETRIDRRTLAAQGLERVPQLHQGPKVMALEQQGIRTERGDQARAIDHSNLQLSHLETERQGLER